MESVKLAGAQALGKGRLSGASRTIPWISEGQEGKLSAERKDLHSWMRASGRRRDVSDEPGGSARAMAPHVGER